jgi:hypothetical protein
MRGRQDLTCHTPGWKTGLASSMCPKCPGEKAKVGDVYKEHATSAARLNVEPTKMKTNFIGMWSLQIKAHG